MSDDKLQDERDLQEKRLNDLWQRIEAREAREKTLDEALDTLNKRVGALSTSIDTVTGKSVTFDTKAGELDVAYQKKVTELEEKHKQISALFEQVKTLHDDTFAKADPTVKSKAEILTDHHNSIESFNKASMAMKQEIELFRDYIFGNKEAKIPGFKKEVEDLVSSRKELMEKWDQSYGALKKQIEGLLPGATTTGLATAFQDQKKSYKWFIVASATVFIVSVGTMMLFGYQFLDTPPDADLTDTLLHIVTRLPFFIPATWLAIFAGKKLNQFTRLQEEYSHKETVAKSFEGHRREIDKLPESEKRAILLLDQLSIMVQMLGVNPSSTLENQSHNEKTPVHDALEHANGLVEKVKSVLPGKG